MRFPFKFLLLCGLFAACHTIYNSRVEEVKPSQTHVDASIKEDTEVLGFIHPYKDSLDKIMNRRLGTSTQSMSKGQPESLLGNCISDLVFEQLTKQKGMAADFLFLNNGGFRSALPAGDITLRNVYELMPFDNEMEVLTLDGKKMMQLMNFIANAGGVPVSHLSMEIKNKKPVNVMVDGKALDTTINYRVMTSDYLANGGDNLFFLKDCKAVNRPGVLLRDAIIEGIERKTKNGEILTGKLDGRIK